MACWSSPNKRPSVDVGVTCREHPELKPIYPKFVDPFLTSFSPPLSSLAYAFPAVLREPGSITTRYSSSDACSNWTSIYPKFSNRASKFFSSSSRRNRGNRKRRRTVVEAFSPIALLDRALQNNRNELLEAKHNQDLQIERMWMHPRYFTSSGRVWLVFKTSKSVGRRPEA